MEGNSCCTCAKWLSSRSNSLDIKTEKDLTPETFRVLPCCGRAICRTCLHKNPRFESYCPFCQISSEPSALPQGLRNPPAYSETAHDATTAPGPSRATTQASGDNPPDYESSEARESEGGTQRISHDVEHHLRPEDCIASLSLAYGVPAHVLRSHNRLHADHLLAARRIILIPRSHYSGPSLSDRPVDDPEELERKSRIRKFMVATKCHEYSVAELYLKQADSNLSKAVDQWEQDENWEKENPFQKSDEKSRAKSRGTGGSLSRQI